MNKDQIAVQMYTVRALAERDLDQTLADLARIGYRAVEFAGFYGRSATEVRELLDKHGLRAVSAHIPLTDFQNRLDGVVNDLKVIGADWGVIPFLGPEHRNEDGLRALGEQFNEYGDRLAEEAIKFAYHNHAFEFEEKTGNGQTLFDMLVSVTQPATVAFELDAFWAAAGGYDPTDVIKQNQERIGLVHLKDAARDNAKHDVPFGEGSLDWASILSASRAANVAYYVTEQDNPNPDDPLGDVETALRNAGRQAA